MENSFAPSAFDRNTVDGREIIFDVKIVFDSWVVFGLEYQNIELHFFMRFQDYFVVLNVSVYENSGGVSLFLREREQLYELKNRDILKQKIHDVLTQSLFFYRLRLDIPGFP